MIAYRQAAPRERKRYQRPWFYHVANSAGPVGYAFTLDGLWSASRLRGTIRALAWEDLWSGWAGALRSARPTWWQALGRWVRR